MILNIVCPSRYKVGKVKLRNSLRNFLSSKSIPSNACVNVVFIGTRKMRQIARDYKKEDVALPVLSFSYKESMDDYTYILGEVFICYPQAVLLSAERNKLVEDMIYQLAEHGLDNILKK